MITSVVVSMSTEATTNTARFRASEVGVIAGSVVLYLVSLMAWWWALYFQVVPMDRILAPFTHPTRDMLDGPLFLVLPLGPPAVFLFFLALRSR
jgi:hypothetical protein